MTPVNLCCYVLIQLTYKYLLICTGTGRFNAEQILKVAKPANSSIGFGESFTRLMLLTLDKCKKKNFNQKDS